MLILELEKGFTGSCLYILRLIFLRSLNTSANSSALLWTYKSRYSPTFLISKSLQTFCVHVLGISNIFHVWVIVKISFFRKWCFIEFFSNPYIHKGSHLFRNNKINLFLSWIENLYALRNHSFNFLSNLCW